MGYWCITTVAWFSLVIIHRYHQVYWITLYCLEPWSHWSQHKTSGVSVHDYSSVIQFGHNPPFPSGLLDHALLSWTMIALITTQTNVVLVYNNSSVIQLVLQYVISFLANIGLKVAKTCKFHSASAHFTEHIQSVLITGLKSLHGLPGVKGLIVAYIGHNPSLSNSHPHRNAIFAAPGWTRMGTINTANWKDS